MSRYDDIDDLSGTSYRSKFYILALDVIYPLSSIMGWAKAIEMVLETDVLDEKKIEHIKQCCNSILKNHDDIMKLRQLLLDSVDDDTADS